MAHKKLQLAGFTDANGDLGRPVPSGHVLVPGQIWIEGASIRWKLAGHLKARQPSREMLTDFVALHQATSPETILRFAREWGVLMMTGGKAPRPCGESMMEGSDPIDAWKYFSRRASAVLNIAAALKDAKLGDLADWGVLAIIPTGDEAEEAASKAAFEQHRYGMGFLPDLPRGTQGRSAVDQGRDLLSGEIDQWLRFWKNGRARVFADLSLRWSTQTRKWELQIEYQGYLFAAIALQLTVVLVNLDQIDKLGFAAQHSIALRTPCNGAHRLAGRLVSESRGASAGDSRAAPPNRRSPTVREAPETDHGGSTSVGLALFCLAGLAIERIHHESRHCRWLAPQRLSAVLDLEDSEWQAGAAGGAEGSSRTDSHDEP
jgi:hypothetical protein